MKEPSAFQMGRREPNHRFCCLNAALMDSLMGMCEWESDSRESAWLANPCELRIRITDVLANCESASQMFARIASPHHRCPCEFRVRVTDVLCLHYVGSAYGRAIRTISRRLENHRRVRANPLGLRIHANCISASQINTS